MRARNVTCFGDFLIPDETECILLDDSGCDQSIVNIKAFRVMTHTGIYFNLGGAMQEFASTRPLEVGLMMSIHLCTFMMDVKKF